MKSGHSLWVLKAIVMTAGCGGASAVAERSEPDRSRVTRLDIVDRRPAFGGTSFGNVGPYELLIARANAVIDPGAALNTGIVDLDRAPRNRDGLVEYSFDVQILKPADITKGNRVLFYEINNRGNRLVYTYFNERDVGETASAIGNGFLMKHGYTAVWSGWLPGDAPVARQRAFRPAIVCRRDPGSVEGHAHAPPKRGRPAATADCRALVVCGRSDCQDHAASGSRCRHDL